MPTIEFKIDDAAFVKAMRQKPAQVRKALQQGMLFAGNIVKEDIRSRLSGRVLKVRSGDLVGNVTATIPKWRGNTLSMRIGPTGPSRKYAATHEFGATIRPKTAKMLAVPLPAAKTASGVSRFKGPLRQALTAEFTSTFVTKKISGKLRLYGIRAKKVVPLFGLFESITIPKRPVWIPALRQNAKRIRNTIEGRIREMLRRSR